MNFTKMQGAGNDFVLIAAGDIDRDWSQLAIAVCDRHFGVGADGLLVLLPSDKADCQMREFNPDGSESGACGNGLRCTAKFILYKGLAVPKNNQILIERVEGIRTAWIDKAEKKETKIKVSMGKPKFGVEDIPVAIESGKESLVDIKPLLNYPIIIGGKELLLNLISMGNPHAVYFEQGSVSDFPLSQLGPMIEQHKIFPNRTNFEVAHVISRQQIETRVWERGVGETLACGSGACAVAVTARLHGYIGNKVGIKLPGGILNVEWDGIGDIYLDGPAKVVFTGKWID